MASGTIERQSGFTNFTSIVYDTDLNNLTDPGVYSCGSAAIAGTLINCPATIAFSMLVMQKGGTKNQVIFAIGTNFGFIYARTQTSTGWNNWFTTNLT